MKVRVRTIAAALLAAGLLVYLITVAYVDEIAGALRGIPPGIVAQSFGDRSFRRHPGWWNNIL